MCVCVRERERERATLDVGSVDEGVTDVVEVPLSEIYMYEYMYIEMHMYIYIYE